MVVKKIILFLCFIVVFVSYAQNTSGIVYYQGAINEKYVDSFLTALEAKKEVPMYAKQRIVQHYRNATPDDFELHFKDGESYYYYEPSLDDQLGEYNVGSKAGRTPYYTDNVREIIIGISPSFGKIAHSSLDWKITQETKKIGKYLCYKAIAIDRLYSKQGHYYNKETIAWFAPEIPLGFGPKYYNGLPGLILQIERDKFILTATKINLNPKDEKIKIKKVGEDEKIITEEEYHARIKELMEARKKGG